MFDFAWSEFAVIAVVALIAIGPKDMPTAIRAVTGALKKARRMASEFQTHVDEMVREANLDEVRDQLSQLRNFDVSSYVEKSIDPDHSLRDTFATNPLDPIPAGAPGAEQAIAAPAAGDAAVAELERSEAAVEAVEPDRTAPAFIPPALIADGPTERPAEAPAFIPPTIAALMRSRDAL
ncbi:MAG TPA: Sec-independent protein translocase protein TatB [Acetobacteraceae bacterium]|nr:Sec-independent protein translocase protein TatB [Acetobacteraceae bacterium]